MTYHMTHHLAYKIDFYLISLTFLFKLLPLEPYLKMSLVYVKVD